MFEAELNLYERELAGRVGGLAAREARAEMAAHLEAAYEARREIEDTGEEARAGALASMGELRAAARGEGRRGTWIWGLFAGPLATAALWEAIWTFAVPAGWSYPLLSLPLFVTFALSRRDVRVRLGEIPAGAVAGFAGLAAYVLVRYGPPTHANLDDALLGLLIFGLPHLFAHVLAVGLGRGRLARRWARG